MCHDYGVDDGIGILCGKPLIHLFKIAVKYSPCLV